MIGSGFSLLLSLITAEGDLLGRRLFLCPLVSLEVLATMFLGSLLFLVHLIAHYVKSKKTK
jgi:hypothetical protein